MRPGPVMCTGSSINIIASRARIGQGAINGAPTGIYRRGRIYAPRAGHMHGVH